MFELYSEMNKQDINYKKNPLTLIFWKNCTNSLLILATLTSLALIFFFFLQSYTLTSLYLESFRPFDDSVNQRLKMTREVYMYRTFFVIMKILHFLYCNIDLLTFNVLQHWLFNF